MATQRTAIGRRLTVRSTSHAPPWRGRQVFHGSIVAPLAASVVLTMVATAAARLALAAAAAERQRRAARSARARDRHFGLVGDEPPGQGIRRMALGQLDLVIEMLETENGQLSAAEAVHEARKALKRLRTLVRLIEDQLGAQAAAREHDALRTAGRRLAGVRDAEVAMGTLDELVRRYPVLARRRGVRRLRARLAAERDQEAGAILADQAARAAVLEELRGVRQRAVAWSVSEHLEIEPLVAPFARIYRTGRRRHGRAAKARRKQRSALMHSWRKSVKDLRYAAEALRRCDPAELGEGVQTPVSLRRTSKRSRRRSRRDCLSRVARRADSLAERLGEEHDLVMLAERVRADKLCGRGTRRALLQAIRHRGRRLRRRSLRDGARLYRRSPRQLAARLRTAHARGARA
jgi:CHAD domain-containing protein